jgi:hypothetical protein
VIEPRGSGETFTVHGVDVPLWPGELDPASVVTGEPVATEWLFQITVHDA